MSESVPASILEQSEGNVLGVRLQGKVSVADVVVVFPELERIINEHGSIRLLMELKEVEGITPAALWEDLKFDVRHFRKCEKMAVVGDVTWEKVLAALSKPIVSGQVKFFSPSELGEAWTWIKT